MTIEEMIKVMEAFKDGKQIQSRCDDTEEWLNVIPSAWNFDKFEFRVKPEPLKCWANIFCDGGIYYDIRDKAVNHAARCVDKGYKVIRVAVPMVEEE